MKKKSLLERTFNFLSSMKLAVVILVLLMAILAAGTILESMYGTNTARILVYRTLWFQILLLLLGVNVLGAALDRLPWKKKHTGFVITHAGILLILAGSFITQYFMIDGNIVLSEGESDSYITLTEPILYILPDQNDEDVIIPISQKGLAWDGREKIKTLVNSDGQIMDFYLRAYYPKAVTEEATVPSESGPAAARVSLSGGMMKNSQWLVENDARQGEINFGVARLKFADRFLKEKLPDEQNKIYLEIEIGGKTVQIPIEKNIQPPAAFPVAGTPYQIQITQVYRHAIIADNKLTERDETDKTFPGANPAVKLELTGGGVKESHTVFAHFPDFPTMHGMKPSETGAKIFYKVPLSGDDPSGHELRFVKTEDGLFYQLKSGEKIQSGKAEVGKPIATGWMDIEALVEEYIEHTRKELTVRPLPDKTPEGDSIAAIQIEVESGGTSFTRWLIQGKHEMFPVGDRTYHMAFGNRRIPAGFRLKLKDFRIQYYPGSQRPQSFESDVVLTDDTRGASKETTISMNEPLVWHGYRIYQSGYSINPGEPEVSIFSVGRDPGIPINYLGSIVMILGIVIMYYTNRYSTNAGRMNS